MTDAGIALQFSNQGIDPAVGGGGYQLWTDGAWNKVVIHGTGQSAIGGDPKNGGRLILKIKAIEGPDAGKEHAIGLNYWHPEPDPRNRAIQELAAITHVTGVHNFQNTSQLYNIPFWILAKNRTSPPTEKYPNPTPQTNFVGYKDLNGVDPTNKSGGASAPGGGAGGPPASFAQPQQAQQPNQAPAFNPGAPAGNPAQVYNPGAGQPQQTAPAFNPGQPQQAQNPFPPQNGGFQPQQQQQPQQQTFAPQQGNGGGWNAQGTGAPQGGNAGWPQQNGGAPAGNTGWPPQQ
jgi:hypothetical protein